MFSWPCNVSDEEDGVAFLLGYDKSMKGSKVAKQSLNDIKNMKKYSLMI